MYGAIKYAEWFHEKIEHYEDVEQILEESRSKVKMMFAARMSTVTEHTYMCERCCERSMYEKAQGICRCHKLLAEDERVVEQQRCRNEFKGGHGLQRNMEKEGRGLICCRQCAGYSTQCLRKRLRNALCTNKVGPSRGSDRIGSMKTQTLLNLPRSQGTSDWRELTDKKSKIDKKKN